jgi:class 3 adenylate cyclase
MITILYIDIVGSTNMAEKLDPEEYRQIVTRLHPTLGDASRREFTASGDPMHQAARLFAAAAPGGILHSLDTFRYRRRSSI